MGFQEPSCLFQRKLIWICYISCLLLYANFFCLQRHWCFKCWCNFQIYVTDIIYFIISLYCIVRNVASQFVYRETLDAVCRPQNNRDPFLKPPAREPVIQKLAKYGMTAPCMLYKTCAKKTNSTMLYLFFQKKALVLKKSNSVQQMLLLFYYIIDIINFW